jgi:hypothetical protein
MLGARCRSICAMALRTICIGSRVSRQCSVTIRPSTRWILEDRRIVHPRDSSGQTQLMNSYWLPSNAQGSGRHGRNWFKCLESSKPGSLWVLCGISVLYTGPGRYRTDDKRAGWGFSARPGSRSLLLSKMWRWRCCAPAWRSVMVKDQSRPDSGLVQNCSAFFHGRFSSDQAERLRGNCRLQI